MTSFNLIDENWIKVKYLDGTIKEVGIRKCFEDADTIEDIIAPSFRRDTMHIYYVPTLRLLTTIVMAAYFKPETNFVSRNLKYLSKFNERLYTDVIKKYLDDFHDRFDILSKDHPFLQNAGLVGKVEPHKDFLSWNPFAPGMNNKVFGKNRSQNKDSVSIIDQYSMSLIEFTYFLLYNSTMNQSPMPAQYKENSLEQKSSTYIVLSGNTLKDTICANIHALNKSIRTDEVYDKPIWEFDSVSDVNSFPYENRQSNLLLCSFYPSISVVCCGCTSDTVTEMIRARGCGIDGVTLNTNESKALAEKFVHPNSIFYISEKNTDCIEYRNFDPSKEYISHLCIIATEHIGDGLSCNALYRDDMSDFRIRVFFRRLEQHCIYAFECGEISGGRSETYDILKDENNHYLAVKYEEVCDKVKYRLKDCIRDVFSYKPNRESQDSKNRDVYYVNKSVKTLSDFIERDFFGMFTDSLINGSEDAVLDATERLIGEANRIISNIICLSDNMIGAVKAKRKFNNQMKKLMGV